MRRVLTALGALASGFIMVLSVPGSSYAAIGTFEFTSLTGGLQVLVNPVDNSCYPIDAIGPATNRTNRDAVVYAAAGCSGGSTTMNPGDFELFLTGKSVKFTS